jgi:hypothetical protein
LDAAADADLVARGLGLPDDSDDYSEDRRSIAAKAWKAAAAVALTPMGSFSKKRKSVGASEPMSVSLARVTKKLEQSLQKLVATVEVKSGSPSKPRLSKNRCFQCNKRGCTPSNASCSHKGKAPHPRSRNGRRKQSKKRKTSLVATTQASTSTEESS